MEKIKMEKIKMEKIKKMRSNLHFFVIHTQSHSQKNLPQFSV